MEPTNQSFLELIGNGTSYIVPRFQRDYAWGQQQWEDLWSDIESLDDEEKYHYMGYIVLQKKGDHEYEIIDGQQRLVTLSLLVIAAMRQIKDLSEKGVDIDKNTERLEVLRSQFIGYKNPISLRINNKLSLNRNNGAFYRSISNSLEAINHRGQTYTNKLLLKGFNFFLNKKIGGSGEEIAEFIEKLSSGMIFTKIVVQDELNAYKVFETLNARGVQLSTPDLLKNYIFSIITRDDDVDQTELNELDEQWSGIVLELGETNFSDFVRYHYNMQNKLVTKNNLFSSVRKIAETPSKAYDYLESLTAYAPVYSSLLKPYEDWWTDAISLDTKMLRKYLDGFSLFSIKQPFTVLMAGYHNFDNDEFIKLAEYLYILSIRYNVICNLSPNEQEKQYNQIAIKISSKDYRRASHVKNGNEFKKLYPSDEEFKRSFEYKKMPSRRSSKKIKFLLSEVESHLGNKINYANTVLEHVCPYNPNQEWNSYFGDNVGDIQDRLGNVLLLDKDELGRNNFEDKKLLYSESNYKLAQKIAEYIDWNIANLNDYQSWLADIAVKTWSVEIC
jgi:hypothetical protein